MSAPVLAQEPALATPSTDLTGRERFGRNVAFAWGGYVVNVIAGFIIPRLISDRLGQTTLGIWDFCWSMVTYFGLVQLGMGGSVTRYVALYRAKGDTTGLNRSVSTIALFQKSVGWLAMVVGIVVAWWILPLFGARLGGQLQAARWVVFILGAEISMVIMLTVYGSVIVGCHRWDIHNSVSALTYGFIAAAMIAVLLLGGGLAALALSHCIFSVAGEVVRWRLTRRICPELIIAARFASWDDFKEQARYGAKNLIPRVADLFSNQALSILITMFLGPAKLAVFSRPRALIRTLQTLAAKFGFILVPTASSLHAREDRHGLQMTLKTAPACIAALVVPAIVTLAILGDYVIRLWMGGKYVYPGLVPVLAVGALAPLVQEPVWSILSGMNVHGRIALYKMGSSIASAILLTAGLGLMKWNLLGAAVCLTVPQVAVDGFVTPYYACRRLGVSLSQYYWVTFLKPFVCLIPYTLSLIAIPLLYSYSVWSIALILSGGTIPSAYLYWRYLIPPRIQRQIAGRLGFTMPGPALGS
jgi:O-antigen/teichoic acid export membrane protein